MDANNPSDTDHKVDSGKIDTAKVDVQLEDLKLSTAGSGNIPDTGQVTGPNRRKEKGESERVDRDGMKSKVVIVENVYYQEPKVDPVQVTSTFSRWMGVADHPYIRRIELGQDWKPLKDKCWLECVSHVIVQHLGERLPSRKLTVEEITDYKMKAVVLAVLPKQLMNQEPQSNRTMWSPKRIEPDPTPFAIIFPGEAIRIPPLNLDLMVLRCVGSEVKCLLTMLIGE